MNRRHLLGIIGGGAILAATGIGWRVSRSADAAVKPWELAGSAYTEPRRKALSYAILAPNPHNRQPWLVDLSTPDQVTLTVDTAKMLPHTDPLNRQITVGLGCFLELMVMAAAEDGYRVDLDLFPQGSDAAALDGRPVCVATFAKDANTKPDLLFAHVMTRRSVKEPYDTTRPVAPEIADRIAAAARSTRVGTDVSEASIESLRKLSSDALIIELETPRTYKESVDLFRIGADEVNANPDGIDFSGPAFEAMHIAGIFSREAAMDPQSTGYIEGRKAVLENTTTAMGHIWQVTPDNSREQQIAAGRDWLRLNLASTAEGVSMQPLSQALQEYVEMEALYKEVHDRFAPDGGTVQMFARLGYAAPVAASPRWPLEAKIV
ncbi:MAG: twin-arginine translocation pathway signal protein [Pseudomonadota bacterium]